MKRKSIKRNASRCSSHKAYAGKRTPRTSCPQCWAIYSARHPRRAAFKKAKLLGTNGDLKPKAAKKTVFQGLQPGQLSARTNSYRCECCEQEFSFEAPYSFIRRQGDGDDQPFRFVCIPCRIAWEEKYLASSEYRWATPVKKAGRTGRQIIETIVASGRKVKRL